MLGECFNFLKTSNFSRGQTTQQGDVAYIHYGDIHTKYPLLVNGSDVDLFVSNKQAEKYDFLKTGDLILLDASEDYEGATKCIEIADLENKKMISGLHTLALRDLHNNFVNGFKSYIASIPSVKRDFWSKITGVKVYGISKSNLKKIRIPFPSLSEQKAIAGTLGIWDAGIEKVSQLIKLKEKQKRAIMQKIFTGKTRLNGFSKPWREVKLGEVCEIKKGKQLGRLEMLENGSVPVMNGGILPSGFTNSFNENENTITISEGGNSCGFVSLLKEKFWCGGHCYVLKNLKVEILFLFQILKQKEQEIMRLRVGSGLPNIQKTVIEKFSFYVPDDIDEQRAIAGTLSVCDEELALLNKKLALLREQKKSLMQQLLTGKMRLKF